MLKILINITLFCSIFISSLAQKPGTSIYTLTNDNTQEQLQINTLYQIKQGYILVGTSKGLYRFDGINFTVYPKSLGVPDNITAICEMPGKDEILIGFENGRIGKLSQKNRLELLPLDTLEEIFPKVPVTKMLVDERGTIWIATSGEGLYFYKAGHLYNINSDDGLSDNAVSDICLLPNSSVAAATDRGINICTSDVNKKVISKFTSKNGLPDNIVTALFTTNNGNLWFGMQDGGLSSYNIKSGIAAQSKPWNLGPVNGMLVMPSRVYIATEEHGVLVYGYDADNNLTALKYDDQQLKKVKCLLRDKEGNIWAAGNNQLMRTALSELEAVYTFKSDSYDDLHTLMIARNGDIWFNKKQKLIRLSRLPDGELKENGYIIKSIAPQSDITSLYEDEKGIIWVGTMGSGLIVLDPQTGKYRAITEDSVLINGSVLSISGKKNTVWIASLEGAVSFEESDTLKAISQTYRSKNYADDKSLGSKYVYDILIDSKNRKWFATDGKGIILLENDQFVHYNKNGSAENEVVYKIVEDNEGNLWFSTYTNGIIKFDGKRFIRYGVAEGLSELNITSLAISGNYLLAAHKSGIDLVNTHNGNISYLGALQGISNINSDFNTFTTTKDGDVYFANGFTIYKYKAPFQLKQKPSIVIDKVQLFLNDTLKQSGQTFAADENNISFFYTGLFYSQPDKIKYQYKLEGYDTGWITTKDRMKNYPILQPNVYTFRVRVSLSQDFSGASEAGFTFTIEKPYWQQLWFILLCALLSAGVIYFLIKQREASIEKYNILEREKIQSQLETLRNQINPHFLFNSFNTLISEIEENPDKAVIYVEHLSDFYRNIVVHKEKDFIKLGEEIAILNDYFFIQQKRYGQALQIFISVTPEQEKMYYVVPLALQLLFENAVKHNVVSTETPLKIELFVEGNEQLIIRNNLSEKFRPEKGSNMGLLNIQKRYELLCGKTVIIEKDQHFFTVKIPLIKQ